MEQTAKNSRLRVKIISIFLVVFVAFSGLLVVTIKQRKLPLDRYSPTVPQAEIVINDVLVNAATRIDLITSNVKPTNDLPKFIIQNGNQLILNPTKDDIGEYYIKYDYDFSSIVYSINVKNNEVNFDNLYSDLKSFLTKKGLLEKYGIWIKDIKRDKSLNINGDVIFPPASMAKMTMALLVMRDIDAGKYTLESTYPLQKDLIFNEEDALGKLGAGIEVPIRIYLERLLEDSNNTAWYHLDKFLGGSYESVNPRTIEELGVNPLFLNPHQGSAENLGKIFEELYNAKNVSEESRDYLIGMMMHALPWNKEGIGLGLPDDVKFANKIGNLWTDKDINYCDSAIVYGKNTDYILIIMNKDIDWISGKENLKEISKIVYSYLDK